jgi:hypothetical protein
VPAGYDGCPVRAAGEEAGACAAERILFLRYDLGLDPDNRAEAGRSHSLSLSAYHQPTADGPAPRIGGLRLWVSYDGGDRWQAVDARAAGGGRYRATLKHPRDDRAAVSLRAEAWDDAGGRIEQTILDAYRLKADDEDDEDDEHEDEDDTDDDTDDEDDTGDEDDDG